MPPFAGGFAGLGLSITARALLVDDEVQVELLKKRTMHDLDSVKLTDEQQIELNNLISSYDEAARRQREDAHRRAGNDL